MVRINCNHGVYKNKSQCKLCGNATLIIAKSKVRSSKAYDLKNGNYDIESTIDIQFVLGLINSSMNCFYCSKKMQLYFAAHDFCSIERILNDVGHNKENCVLCCLECNLKRTGSYGNLDLIVPTQPSKICYCGYAGYPWWFLEGCPRCKIHDEEPVFIDYELFDSTFSYSKVGMCPTGAIKLECKNCKLKKNPGWFISEKICPKCYYFTKSLNVFLGITFTIEGIFESCVTEMDTSEGMKVIHYWGRNFKSGRLIGVISDESKQKMNTLHSENVKFLEKDDRDLLPLYVGNSNTKCKNGDHIISKIVNSSWMNKHSKEYGGIPVRMEFEILDLRKNKTFVLHFKNITAIHDIPVELKHFEKRVLSHMEDQIERAIENIKIAETIHNKSKIVPHGLNMKNIQTKLKRKKNIGPSLSEIT